MRKVSLTYVPFSFWLKRFRELIFVSMRSILFGRFRVMCQAEGIALRNVKLRNVRTDCIPKFAELRTANRVISDSLFLDHLRLLSVCWVTPFLFQRALGSHALLIGSWLTRDILTGWPTSAPPCIRKPHGDPPSKTISLVLMMSSLHARDFFRWTTDDSW